MSAVVELDAAGTWHGPAALAATVEGCSRLADGLAPRYWPTIASYLTFSREVATELGPHVLGQVVEAVEVRAAERAA